MRRWLWGCLLVGCGSAPVASAVDASIEADAAVDGAVPDAGDDHCTTVALCPNGCTPPFVPGPTHGVVEGGVCTDQQIDGFWKSCLLPLVPDAGDDGGACAPFRTANAACVSCLDTDDDASAWGALVRAADTPFYRPNVSGCLAKTSADASCAVAAELAWTCPDYVCKKFCGTVPLANDTASIPAYAQCFWNARKTSCATWTKNDCVPADAGPTAACAGDQFEQAYANIAKVVCGK